LSAALKQYNSDDLDKYAPSMGAIPSLLEEADDGRRDA
jgi:hypothetical protein